MTVGFVGRFCLSGFDALQCFAFIAAAIRARRGADKPVAMVYSYR